MVGAVAVKSWLKIFRLFIDYLKAYDYGTVLTLMSKNNPKLLLISIDFITQEKDKVDKI